MRLGYNSGPTLAYWWLDSYFDFDGEQSVRMRDDLQTMQDWHRKDELPQLVQTLKELQAMAAKPVTPTKVCTIVANLQTRLQVTLDRLTPTIAAIASTLKDAQLEHIAQEFERRNNKWHEDWIAGTLVERSQRRVKQIVERAESFYGPLDTAQITMVRTHISRSSFDGPRQYKEMQRRHKSSLQALRELRTANASPAQATAIIRELLEQTLKAPDPAYRKYMDVLTTESCAAMAALHNSSTAEQRTRLAQTLQAYEADARALSGQSPAMPPAPQSPTAF